MSTIVSIITTLLTIYATDIATGTAKVEAQKILNDWMSLVATLSEA